MCKLYIASSVQFAGYKQQKAAWTRLLFAQGRVLPVGIEPTSQVPETCILSIKLWERAVITVVRLPGLEPGITDPKSVVISISPQAQLRGCPYHTAEEARMQLICYNSLHIH